MAVPSRTPPRSSGPMLNPLQDVAAARARLRDIIHERSFGYGEIKLASGRTSNFYFNLKPSTLDAERAALLAQLPLHALKGENVDYIGGLDVRPWPLTGARARGSV